ARRASILLSTEPTIVPGPLGADALPAGALSVDLDHVTFAYGDGAPALVDVDLHVPAGTHVGIVGRTGSGKTTIGRLVLRAWDATRGTVRVGGVDVRALDTAALRSRIAVVTQAGELFRANLRDNLTLFGAHPADDATLVAALVEVGLDEWLAHTPHG